MKGMGRKILVVSDSHGFDGNIKKVISHFGKRGRELELFIHLGDSQESFSALEHLVDCPVKAVRGNCDYSGDFPLVDFVEIAGERAMITHGHRYDCKYSTDTLREMAEANDASIVMFGHTHIPMIEEKDGITVVNPGSISLPRQESGQPTYLVVTIEEDDSIRFDVVEM